MTASSSTEALLLIEVCIALVPFVICALAQIEGRLRRAIPAARRERTTAGWKNR